MDSSTPLLPQAKPISLQTLNQHDPHFIKPSMEEGRVIPDLEKPRINSTNNKHYKPLLAINYALLFIGSVSSTLLSKFYFVHNGSSRWVSTLVQCAGFPFLLPIIYFVGITSRKKPFSDFTSYLLVMSVLVGLLLGVNNLLFSWGNSYLPVSTSSLLLSSQLAFTLLLSAIIVRTRLTFNNLNAVVLLTLAALLLALSSPRAASSGQNEHYFAGFACTIAAGLLFALYLPVMERVYRRVTTYQMVMEMQFVMEAAATALALVGMVAEKGFSEMSREANSGFGLGRGAYWWTVLGNVVTWQMCFMGTAGMVFLTTSVTGGICMTALMGMNVVGGVVVYGDEFGGIKAVAAFLCVWGFLSYVYGLHAKMMQAVAAGSGKAAGGHGGRNGGDREMEMTARTTNSV